MFPFSSDGNFLFIDDRFFTWDENFDFLVRQRVRRNVLGCERIETVSTSYIVVVIFLNWGLGFIENKPCLNLFKQLFKINFWVFDLNFRVFVKNKQCLKWLGRYWGRGLEVAKFK